MRGRSAAGILLLGIVAAVLAVRLGSGASPAGEKRTGDALLDDTLLEDTAAPGLRGAGSAGPRGAPPPPSIRPRAPRVRGPLLVRVVWSDGEPRPGVEVRVRALASLHPRSRATTDERGLARFAAVDRDADVVEAIAEGFRPTSTEREGFAESGGVLEFTLERGTEVPGRVVDAATGEGLAGATVWLHAAEHAYEIAVTDATGRFVVPGIAEGFEAEVAASAPGRLPARERVAFEDGGTPAEPVLRLARGGALVGVVRTSDGAPVAGAQVAVYEAAVPEAPEATSDGRPFVDSIDRFRSGDGDLFPRETPEAEGRTDADGGFRFDGIEADADHAVRVRAAGFVPAGDAAVRTSSSGDAGPVTVVLRRAASVRLRVARPAEGALPPSASARLFHGDAVSRPVDEAGGSEFLFAEVRPGPVAAVVRAYGFRLGVVRGTAVEGEETSLAMSLEPVGAISGVCVDVAGRPLPHAQVTARPDGERVVPREPVAVADDQGRFEVRGFEVAEVQAAWQDATEPLRAARTVAPVTVRAPASDVHLVLVSRGWLRLRVPGDDPAAPGWVALRRTDVGAHVLTKSLVDGVLALGNLDDGEYEVIVTATDRTFVRRSVPIDRGVGVDLGDVVLKTGASVSGRVVDSRGRPVAGATVAPSQVEEVLGNASGRDVMTGEDGSFTLAHLPSGIVPLRVSRPGWSPAWVDAAPGTESRVEVRLAREATLRGTMKGPAGTSFEGIPLLLRRMAAEIAADGAAGDAERIEAVDVREDGAFAASVPPGTWTAVFTDRGGGEHVLGSWRLAEGTSVEVVLRLPGS